jgi:hypothetical protein
MSSKVDALCSQDGDTIPVLLCGADFARGAKDQPYQPSGESKGEKPKRKITPTMRL